MPENHLEFYYLDLHVSLIILKLYNIGSRKYEIAQFIARKYNICHISISDLLHKEVGMKNDNSINILKQINNGELVNDKYDINSSAYDNDDEDDKDENQEERLRLLNQLKRRNTSITRISFLNYIQSRQYVTSYDCLTQISNMN